MVSEREAVDGDDPPGLTRPRSIFVGWIDSQKLPQDSRSARNQRSTRGGNHEMHENSIHNDLNPVPIHGVSGEESILVSTCGGYRPQPSPQIRRQPLGFE